jgi:myo-inositol-1(or 4)-monophosphatase
MLTHQELQQRLAVAKHAAQKAGLVLLDHYRNRDRLEIDQKGVNDFVSNADQDAEKVVFAILQAHFPQDRLLGEEQGFGGQKGAVATWCIDPLDGTSNFLKGAHNWCVSIGLVDDAQCVLGVIYDPVRDELFEGAVGLGVRCNGISIHVATEPMPDRSAIGIGHTARIPVDLFIADTGRLLKSGAGFRQVGAGALMLAYVAAGRVNAYFERHMWSWDAVAGLALIREAGGMIAPYPAQEPLDKSGLVLAATPRLYVALHQILQL